MKFEQETVGDVVVLTAIPTPAPKDMGLVDVKREVDALVEKGLTRIVVDIKNLDFLNSTEIGALIGSLRLTISRKGVLVLCGIGLRLAETLFLVRMHIVFPFRLSRKEAILEATKCGKDPGHAARLVAGNPSLEEIRHWWDVIIRKQLEDNAPPIPSHPESVPPAPPSAPETSDQPPSSPPTAFPPKASSSSASPELLSGEITSRIPPAKFWKTYIPDTDRIPAEFAPNLNDWILALQVFRHARDLWSKQGLPFSANVTFKEFIGRLAEVLSEKSAMENPPSQKQEKQQQG